MSSKQALSTGHLKTFPDRSILENSSKLLVQMSEAIYRLPEKPSTVESWAPLDDYWGIKDGTNQPRATIYKRHKCDEYAIVFKGSSSFVDWIADFGIETVPFIPHKYQGRNGGGTNIHVGFNLLYNKILSKHSMATILFDFIKKTPIDKLYIAGHSLGGALAKLFLYDLMISLESKFPEIISVTFGAPRIGLLDASMDFEALHRHLTAKGKKINYISEYIVNDIVPYLPPFPYCSSGESLAVHSGNPIEHMIASYVKFIYRYFDHEEQNFKVKKKDGVISLVDGLLAWNGKNIIDLVPGHSRLSDIFPRIDNINIDIKPGRYYDFSVFIYGGANSHFKTSHLKFHYEDGSTEGKSIFRYEKHWQTDWQNGGKIVRIDFYESWDPTAEGSEPTKE